LTLCVSSLRDGALRMRAVW